MKKYLVFTFFICLGLIACKEGKEEVENIEIPPKVIEQKVEIQEYKRLPPNYVSIILNEADGLEGTFYESGKSVSLWDDNVKNVLAMMTEAAPLNLDAKLVGHIMYLKQGQSLAYVEIFLSQNNTFVKYKINEELFYNTLTAQGIQFLNQMATKPAVAPAQ